MRFIELYSTDNNLKDVMYHHTTYVIYFKEEIVGFARNDTYGVELSVLAPSEAGLMIDSGEPSYVKVEGPYKIELKVGEGIYEREWTRLYKKLFA